MLKEIAGWYWPVILFCMCHYEVCETVCHYWVDVVFLHYVVNVWPPEACIIEVDLLCSWKPNVQNAVFCLFSRILIFLYNILKKGVVWQKTGISSVIFTPHVQVSRKQLRATYGIILTLSTGCVVSPARLRHRRKWTIGEKGTPLHWGLPQQETHVRYMKGLGSSVLPVARCRRCMAITPYVFN